MNDSRRPPCGTLLRVGVAAVCIGSACSEPMSCDVCFTTAVAYGRVTFASGTPVIGVPVDVAVYYDACGGVSPGGSDNNQGSRVTTATGNYRRVLVSPLGEAATSCAEVVVNPNGDARWPIFRQEFDVDIALRFSPRGERPDSARLDVVVPDPSI